MIAVIITFRRSNKNSLERRGGSDRSSKKNCIFNKVPVYRNFTSDYEYILLGIVSIAIAVLIANSAYILYIFLSV